jgi:hypothetical protein
MTALTGRICFSERNHRIKTPTEKWFAAIRRHPNHFLYPDAVMLISRD